MRLYVLLAFLFVLVLAGCGGIVVLSGGGAPSPDGELRLTVNVHIGPGRAEREHRIFVGIGDRADNPATKYLQKEYTVRLAGVIDTLVNWEGRDRVTLEVVEYPDDERIKPTFGRRNPAARTIVAYTYARLPGSLMFMEVSPKEKQGN